MSITRFYCQQLFDGEHLMKNKILTVEGGKIKSIDDNTSLFDVYLEGIVAPGYIDLQVNGGGGVLFNSKPNLDTLTVMTDAHSQFGTTAMLPTLITDELSIMQQAADTVAAAIAKKLPGIIGIHFEGPHLSQAKKGTHCSKYIRGISDDEWAIFSRKDLGQIMVTLAPETVKETDIERLVSLGNIVCIGHSNADFKTTMKAIQAGVTGITHLYNAMSPLQGREPGVVGAALLNDNVNCGLIVDGFHVDDASCQLAIKTKPKGSVFLVTDAMPVVGTNETQFDFFDRVVYADNGKLTSTTGELAGSSLTMENAVKNTHHRLQLPLAESLRMASLYPAQHLYQHQSLRRGKLIQGFNADFVVLDDELSIKQTWIAGEKVFF